MKITEESDEPIRRESKKMISHYPKAPSFPGLSMTIAIGLSLITMCLQLTGYGKSYILFFCTISIAVLMIFIYSLTEYINHKPHPTSKEGTSPELLGYRMCVIDLQLYLANRVANLESDNSILENDRKRTRVLYGELQRLLSYWMEDMPRFLKKAK